MQTPRGETGHAHSGHPPWLMALCLLPIAAVAALVLFGMPLPTMLLFGVFLLCPLMHLLMMGGHGQAGHGGRGTTEQPSGQPSK